MSAEGDAGAPCDCVGRRIADDATFDRPVGTAAATVHGSVSSVLGAAHEGPRQHHGEHRGDYGDIKRGSHGNVVGLSTDWNKAI